MQSQGADRVESFSFHRPTFATGIWQAKVPPKATDYVGEQRLQEVTGALFRKRRHEGMRRRCGGLENNLERDDVLAASADFGEGTFEGWEGR